MNATPTNILTKHISTFQYVSSRYRKTISRKAVPWIYLWNGRLFQKIILVYFQLAKNRNNTSIQIRCYGVIILITPCLLILFSNILMIAMENLNRKWLFCIAVKFFIWQWMNDCNCQYISDAVDISLRWSLKHCSPPKLSIDWLGLWTPDAIIRIISSVVNIPSSHFSFVNCQFFEIHQIVSRNIAKTWDL